MVTIARYSSPLNRAIRTMREQMARPENVAKPDWAEATTAGLESSIYHNLDGLQEAIENGDRDAAFIRAANVANHAWMIADNVPERG